VTLSHKPPRDFRATRCRIGGAATTRSKIGGVALSPGQTESRAPRFTLGTRTRPRRRLPCKARKPRGCVSLTGASDACGSSASVVHASARDACLAFRPARSATSSPWGHSWVQTWPNRARSGLSRAAPRAFDSPDSQARRREVRSRRVASHARGRRFETRRAHRPPQKRRKLRGVRHLEARRSNARRGETSGRVGVLMIGAVVAAPTSRRPWNGR
jgi:hypothetical protein